MELISFVVCFIMGFTMCFISYRQGIKDGQRFERRQTITEVIKSPVSVIKEAKEAKEINETAEAINNMLAYDGRKQK